MHKLLFDQNLSYKIIKHIEHFFPESSHVHLLDLDTSDDLTVWKYAQDHDFTIITKDSDFDAISILNGFPPKIIRLNTGNALTQTIIDLLLDKAEIIEAFLNNEAIGFLELE